MISAKEAREISSGKAGEVYKDCQADLEAAIKAAATLGDNQIQLHKESRKLKIMLDIAKEAGYDAGIVEARDQRDVDYLTVRW